MHSNDLCCIVFCLVVCFILSQAVCCVLEYLTRALSLALFLPFRSFSFSSSCNSHIVVE